MTKMPRLNKAQLEQHALESRAQIWSEFCAQYPFRFAKLLHQYLSEQNHGFRVTRSENNQSYFFTSGRDYWAEGELYVTPPEKYDSFFENRLIQLEQAIELHYEEIRRQREDELKRAALLKRLTEEERRLLNL